MDIRSYIFNRKNDMRTFVDSLKTLPHLVIIQVNDDPASNAYVRGKIKDGDEIGVKVTLDKMDINTTQAELLERINKYNNDDQYHGLIVQMPLPKHINEEIIKLAVNPKKDVDGFHPLTKFDACTPKGIIKYLEHEGVEFAGKNAVVIGRSNIVGKPMAKLLLNKNCNIVQLHSKTSNEDMRFYLEHADIIVVAVGRKHFLNNTYKLKETAVLVDVGINRDEAGLHGDIEPNLNVKIQTPVPCGVGLLTRLTLLENLLEAYKNGI